MRRFRPATGADGFTITEMVAVVVIIAVGSALTLAISGRELRRERINSAAVGLSGWIEEVRRAALKGNPCTVTIGANAGAARGTVIASAAPVASGIAGATTPTATCQATNPYQVATDLGSTKVAVQPLNGSNFNFGVLGTVSPTTPTNKEWVLTLIKPNGQSDLSRCLRIRGLMGFVEVGNRSGSTCTYPSRY